MNHSLYSADRMTHLKIVVVGLVAAIGIAGLSISAHMTAEANGVQTAHANTPVLKASKTMMLSDSEQQVIR
jgi:hypothetical protein